LVFYHPDFDDFMIYAFRSYVAIARRAIKPITVVADAFPRKR